MPNKTNSKKEKKKTRQQINYENMQKGIELIKNHPLFGDCFGCNMKEDGKNLGKETIATVSSNGVITLNENMSLTPSQWAYVIAHNKLHLAFGHFDADKMPGYTITDEKGKKAAIIQIRIEEQKRTLVGNDMIARYCACSAGE